MPKAGKRHWDALHDLPVNATGALKNTVLIGTQPKCQSTRLILDQDVRPRAEEHDSIKADNNWTPFLAKVFSLPGFCQMENVSQVEKWLEANAVRKGRRNSLGDDEKAQIRILSLGVSPSQFLQLPESVLKRTMSAQEIENLIPRPPSTKPTTKHTLMLHRSGFRMEEIQKKMESNLKTPLNIPKRIYDLDNSQELKEKPNDVEDERQQMFLPEFDLQVVYTSDTKENVLKDCTRPNIPQAIHDFIQEMTAGELRSLLQKLIRFAPPTIVMNVAHGLIEADAREVLIAVLLRFVQHPGGFVPHLGQHVRGLPSLLKRLAVIIVEDAYFPSNEECAKALHSLLLAAIVSTQDDQYFPTRALLDQWFSWALQAFDSDIAVVYDCERASNESLSHPTNPLQWASVYLDYLRSFPWDLMMLRDVAQSQPLLFRTAIIKRADRLPMNIFHFLDHHTSPHLVYYLNPQALKIARLQYNASETFGDFSDSNGSQPYAPLMRAIFQRVSGFNYRRSPQFDPTNEFVRMVQEAQAKLWKIRFEGPSVSSLPQNEGQLISIAFQRDPMWISGQVGHTIVKCGHVDYYGFISKMKPKVEFGVVRVPSRGQKDTVINEEHAEIVKQKTAEKWREGFNVSDGVRVFLNDENEISMMKQNQMIPVDSYLSLRTTVSNQIYDESMGLIQSLEPFEKRRLWQLTSNFQTTISFPKITRNGGPEDEPVCTHDIALFQMLLKSPLVRHSGEREFRVFNEALFFHVRERLNLNNLNDLAPREQWPIHEDSSQRTPTVEQLEALGNLIDRKDQRANVLVMLAGSGKTRVIMEYLLFLSRSKKLPKYIVYALPRSALDDVKREIGFYCDQVIHVDARKSKGFENNNVGLKSHTVTMIDLDHLRRIGNQWDDYLSEMFFIGDEFHLALAATTQRSQMVQKFCFGAERFLVLSGTPALNDNYFQLTPYISQCVHFPVDPRNFFVAYSAVSQYAADKTMEVNDFVKHVDVPTENHEFWNLLPVALGGKNQKRLEASEFRNLQNAVVSVASQLMVQLAREMVQKGHRVFLVAQDKAHAFDLKKRIPDLSMRVMGSNEDVTSLRSHLVSNPPQILIAPIRVNAGYSATAYDVQISGLYESNAASRAQIRGRINRLGSEYKQISYYQIIVGPIQELIAKKYDRHDSFLTVLRDLECVGVMDKRKLDFENEKSKKRKH